MPVDDVLNLELGQPDLPDAPQLVLEFIPFGSQFTCAVGEDPVAVSLADVEGLTIPWVDQAVDVVAELLNDLGCSTTITRPHWRQ